MQPICIKAQILASSVVSTGDTDDTVSSRLLLPRQPFLL